MGEAELLHIGVDAWIIQDGNYPDFATGERRKFALEFYPPKGLAPAARGPQAAEFLDASRYHVRGRVVYAERSVWVIDAGLFMAFQESKPPPHAAVGAWVEGEVYLGIDPYFYFEYLHRQTGMPPLMYEFLVRGISRETSPWIDSKDAAGRLVRQRDAWKQSFEVVPRTDAWHDDNGGGHYVLTCERLSGPG